MNSYNLSNLKIGESGVVEDFSDPSLSLKLMEMGCIPGEKIKLHKYAPMGDPMMVEVSGYFLTLRKQEAETIIISLA